ncbi:hypothetical protein D3C85_929370 [compost metagenome]
MKAPTRFEDVGTCGGNCHRMQPAEDGQWVDFDDYDALRQLHERVLKALRELQANPNDPRAHRVAMDVFKAVQGPGLWTAYRRMSAINTTRRWSVSRETPEGVEYLKGNGKSAAKFMSEAAAIAAANKANGSAS